MLKPLTSEEKRWVETTLAGMTVEEKIGHLLCPEDHGDYTLEDWLAIIKDVPLGSAFFGFNPLPRVQAILEAIQKASRIPLLIASDLEHGAGAMIPDTVTFPWPMAVGAANDAALAHRMGQWTAREGRAHGCHWTFSPIVDLNVNFQNPVTNVRSLGDNPRRVSRLAAAVIEGIQEGSELAATAKHFPGDGMDDRDQHFCTSINSCTVRQWWQTYGKVWRAAIDAGVMSIMVGHISFPAYEGLEDEPAAALPATLNPRLQIDLLRNELGFKGVVVSDAAPMVGIASRVRAEEEALQNILSGSNVYLFAKPRQDFAYLMQALRSGRLPLERVEQSVRRVLEMKARLGLHHGVKSANLTVREQKAARRDALKLAEKSITLLRSNAMTPLKLQPGAKVLTVSVHYENFRNDPQIELPVVDEELRQRGFHVDHLSVPEHTDLFAKAGGYDAVLFNVMVHPHSRFGTIRLTGNTTMPFWEGIYANFGNMIFTSFGSPYLLYEQPHLPNLYLAYGHSPASQAAAVRVWLGEIPPRGKCPVKLPWKKMGL